MFDVGGWVLNGVFGWLAGAVSDVLGWLLQFMTAAFFTTPDVTVLPQVTGLAQRSSQVVAAVFVLAILAAGVLGMTSGSFPGSFRVAYQVKDLVPRLVVGFGLSVFGTGICRGLVEVFNAVTQTLIGPAASGPRTITQVQTALRSAYGPGSILSTGLRAMIGLVALVIVVLFLQLLVTYGVRVAMLLILAGVAPVALACYALPQTQPIATLWWRTLLGTLITPALQGAAFSAGIDLILNPDHTLPLQLAGGGQPQQGAVAAMNLLLAAAVLWMTVRIPRLVARYARSGQQSSTVGIVVRTVVTQTLLRRIPGLSRLTR